MKVGVPPLKARGFLGGFVPFRLNYPGVQGLVERCVPSA